MDHTGTWSRFLSNILAKIFQVENELNIISVSSACYLLGLCGISYE